MIFKVIGTFRSALSRQIFEAVRMKDRGIHALNSKGEFDRCKIHRLTVGEDKKTTSWVEDNPQGIGNTGAEGEEYLMSRRIEKDRNSRRDLKGNVSVTNQKKRNMVGEESTRPPKKRKFVLVGPDWGNSDKPKDQGLDCRVGTAPLPEQTNNEKEGNKKHIEKTGTGPLLVQSEGPKNTPRLTNKRLARNVPPEENVRKNEGGNIDGGTAPLSVPKETDEQENLGVGNKTEGAGPLSKRRTSQEQDDTRKVDSGTCPLQTNEGEHEGLYEAASNVLVLREERADCVVRKMWCTTHNQEAKRISSKRSVWTRVSKTGLYGWRTRKVSVLRCEKLDGAGE